MRAAPAFELTLGLSAAERGLLALLCAAASVALAAWVWSHVDAAFGPSGLGAWPWFVLVPAAAGAGAWVGWSAARPKHRALRWRQGGWTWSDGGIEYQGAVQARIDLGSWLLLVLCPQQGGPVWVTVGRRRAGSAWHPLRAALFAPGVEPGAGEGTPR